jgi:predicted transcriptional regulator
VSTTTTIRVDRAVHERLLRISKENGQQLVDVIGDATEALERVRFAEKVRGELDALRADPVAWAAYVGDLELAVADGIA